MFAIFPTAQNHSKSVSQLPNLIRFFIYLFQFCPSYLTTFLSLIDLASSSPDAADSSPASLRCRHRPFLHLTRVGTLDDDFFSGDDDDNSLFKYACAQIDERHFFHALSLLTGLIPHSLSLSAALILRYAAFNSPSASRRLFSLSVPHSRSAFLYNTLIRAFSLADVDDRFHTYNLMVRRGVRLDDHTFPFVIKTCSDSTEINKAMEVHCTAFKLWFNSNVYVGNTLVQFYGSIGKLSDARKMFDEMPERDVVSWNTIIRVFSANGGYVEALHCYREMSLGVWCKPNVVSVISVLPVCAELADEVMALQVHCYVVKSGLGTQVMVGYALVDVYGKCWNVRASKQVFDELSQRNEVSWNAAITGLSYVGDNVGAFDTFRSMIGVGVRLNSVTISSMSPVLVELELFGVGKELHGFSVKMGIESDVFIVNSLINLYSKSGHSDEASNVFREMDERNIFSCCIAMRECEGGVEIDEVTLLGVASACAHLGVCRYEDWVRGIAEECGFGAAENVLVGSVFCPYVKHLN